MLFEESNNSRKDCSIVDHNQHDDVPHDSMFHIDTRREQQLSISK